MSDRPLIIGVPGVAGLATLSQQQIIDIVEKAQPADPFGFIIFGGTTPDVATYPWLAKCVWLDSHVFKEYDTGTATWGAVTSGSILNTSQVADDIITPAKLSNDSASAFNILRTNGSNAPEWASLAAILIADTVPLLAINNTGADVNAVLQSIGGVTQWTAYSTLSAAIVASITSYDIQKLSGGFADAMLITDGAGAKAFILISDFLATKIADGSLNPLKINSTPASDLQVLTKKDGVSKFATPIFTKEFSQVDPAGAMPATGANVKRTFTHGLGVRPKVVELRLICTSAEHGYSVGDEISMDSLCYSTALTSYAHWGHINVTTTEIHALLRTALAGYYSNCISDASPPATVTLTAASWSLKVYAYA